MKRRLLLISLTLVAILIVFLHGPIPQDPSYHNFADGRILLGIRNGYNFLSNVFFIIPGLWGIIFTLRLLVGGKNDLINQYLLFFVGIFLTGFGSGFYHYDPSNASLVWDRLPMSVAFMALLSSVISESVDRRAGVVLLVPLLIFGAFSVGYWAWSENAGRGDLRLYVLAQFLPVLLVPLILLLYRPPRIYSVHIWALAVLYSAAKLFELLDGQIYSLAGFVSGHTLKHVMAGAGSGCILRMLYERKIEFKNPEKTEPVE